MTSAPSTSPPALATAAGPMPALVLGCSPGPALDARVDAGVALWRTGAASLVVISGAAEAHCGAARWRAAGLPATAIWLDLRARNTRDNLVEARRRLGGGPLWLVTDGYHYPRAASEARRVGFSPAPWLVERAWPWPVRARELAARAWWVLRSR